DDQCYHTLQIYNNSAVLTIRLEHKELQRFFDTLDKIESNQCRKVTFLAFFVSRPDGWKEVPLPSEIK
ncbi:MAG: hypothetical protein J6N50_00330, partial [Bacteroidales bacterium]|nr:hypothetical protein [Bacteroidales bacterium]